jgi:TolB-like protein/Tfp pilus assembly protein PilF
MVVGESPASATAVRSVFLSYAHADQARATQLAQVLERAGHAVWWDALIEAGAAFANSIESALERADVVVVLWSATSVNSNWVRDEASTGRDRNKLIPISLDGTEPPLGFKQFHATDLSNWDGSDGAPQVHAILRGIATLARSTAPDNVGEGTITARARHTPATAPAARPAATSRRAVVLTLAGATAVGAGAWLWSRRDTSKPTDTAAAANNSVAVLPFKNLTGDSGQAYFSDGLAEEVRATLARDPQLLVMAQASAGKFRDEQADAKSIATRLGVAYLLAGSVRRAGDSVRVAADLIDGASGFSKWSQLFERKLSDVFAVQSEIAQAVVAALLTTVASNGGTSQAVPSPAYGGTTNAQAYDAYLRGRALYDLAVDEASDRAALAQFDRAIEIDANFAAAHSARARTLTAIANQYGEAQQLAALYDAAIAAAERAIALAPELADAHSTLGYTLFQGRFDVRGARAPFERSRSLGGGEATVLARFAQYSARAGRHADAEDAIQRALRLDPLNPLIHRAVGSIYFAARAYERSIAPLRDALALNPKLSRTHAAIGDALVMLGRLPAAAAEYAKEPAQDLALTGKGIVAARQNDRAGAQSALQALLAAMGDKVGYQQAQIHTQLGELDAAMRELQRARAYGDGGLIYARNDPFLDPLRADPRFAELLAQLGFD